MGCFKTTCIITLLSVTICLVILHFTTGLKVLPTGDQTKKYDDTSSGSYSEMCYLSYDVSIFLHEKD